MQSLRTQWLRSSGALLVVSCMSATLACSSQYEPEGQFWPDLEPTGFGVSESDAGSNASTELVPELTAGAGGSRNSTTGGSASGASGTRGETTAANAGSSIAVVAASQTCSLSVSVTTVAPGGKYRPRNVGAIWIADSGGLFLKSLDVWGNRRLSHVTAWTAATKAAGVPNNKVDAVSSATLSAHREHDVTWNCTDYAGKVVPDGTYRVYFEVTDSNNSGPNHFETFVKGPNPTSAQSSATNFTGIALTFKP